ncbi:hypothetical protein [Pontiella sulfatireligans]|uniref:TIGR02646 family protein n=1 Tax=Pontiella sulfatireligans TaxID=2750658 RepID=A0A6C2UNF7_9BACT|nr:hypothetical protein [Pontiella sulfatireligans]VGO21718.1 hypothetical protein SCARR_03792 [Pontiella sulfatireligans]
MLKCTMHPEPPGFQDKVGKPGANFLKNNPNPKSSDFPAYWSYVHSDLYSCYRGICNFCATWMPRASKNTGNEASSIDHFIPKTVDKNAAYKWSNYRLCRGSINNSKDISTDVLDPFHINNNWFEMDFRRNAIKPADCLSTLIESQVQDTIRILGLNGSILKSERLSVIIQYLKKGGTTIERRYPFLHKEMVRVDFDNTLADKLRSILNKHKC